MKRSEMIEYIADELRDIISVYLSSSPKYSGTDKFYKNKADGMLDMLEDFGMLPPPKEESNEDKPNYVNGVNINNKTTWEWEDETK